MFRISLLLLCICMSSNVIATEEMPNKTIIIAGDNWCPINCSADSPNKGFMIDVATEALALSGYSVKYEEIPWTRAVGLARKGKIHGIVGAFKGDAPDFHFSQSPLLNISPNSLFAKKQSSWRYNGIRSLNAVRLGAIKGYDYGEKLNNYIQSVASTDESSIVQIYGNDAVNRSIQFLLRDRIDVFVETGPVFWYQVKQMGISDQVVQVGNVSEPEPCFIAFSPNLEVSQQLSNALDKGMAILKKQGRVQQIADKYGLPKTSLQ